MRIKKVTINHLLENIQPLSAEKGGTAPGLRYSWEQGFHIYGNLNLHLRLSASEDAANAKQYIRIVQAYASIAEACATIANVVLLEVQGEVIHMLLPCELGKQSTDHLLAFCIIFSDIIHKEIKPMAGEAWQSFVMASEHGQAVLLRNGNGSSDSVVSLGPAANHPAKQLPTTEAGMLSIRPETLELVHPNVDHRKSWEQFDLRNPPYKPLSAKQPGSSSITINESLMRSEASNIITKIRPDLSRPLTILSRLDVSHQFETDSNNPFSAQGFYMRADLDGFTADVQAAFEDKTGQAVMQIVNRFAMFMEFADAFAANLQRPVVRLPWAGDCANMVLLPRDGRSYAQERGYVPATESAAWHELTSKANSAGQNWREYLLKSDWAVSIAGGDDKDDGGDGYLLIANIVTASRRFKIAAGWGAGRSHDALGVEGVKGKDTVVHRVDHGELSPQFQKKFHPLNSIFLKATGLTTNILTRESVKDEGKAMPMIITGTNIYVPPPKPHFND